MNDEPGFVQGEELFIYNSRGNGAGTYEFVKIAQVNGTVLDLATPLENDYPDTDSVFVYRVPHYTTIYVYDGGTITAADQPINQLNPPSGGIVVFRATGSINIIGSGKIDVSGKGYRGYNRQVDSESGFQGEGYLGIGIQNAFSNGNGGGGGGIIYTTTPLLYIKNIIANGENGNTSVSQDGEAGGGAGGSIYILGDEVNIIGDITSLGGIGFTPPNSYGGKGGDGFLGRIRIKAEYIDGFSFPQYFSD